MFHNRTITKFFLISKAVATFKASINTFPSTVFNAKKSYEQKINLSVKLIREKIYQIKYKKIKQKIEMLV